MDLAADTIISKYPEFQTALQMPLSRGEFWLAKFKERNCKCRLAVGRRVSSGIANSA